MAHKKRFHHSKHHDPKHHDPKKHRAHHRMDGEMHHSDPMHRDPRGHSAHKGSDVSLHRLGDEFYAGYRGRTVQEHGDYMMLHEDHTAIANMPQNVIMKMYPKYGSAMDENLNDDIRGIDHQIREDSKRQKGGEYPEKY